MTIIQHCKAIKRLPFDFEPYVWSDFWSANCYEYLLNFKNQSNIPLVVGGTFGKEFQPYQSNDELIKTLKAELVSFGLTIEETSYNYDVPAQKMKIFVSRSRCGDYNFYRLDSNGKWSHKFSYSEPSNLDFNGNMITLPELACSTDINLGYYLIGLVKE